jgi:hypothetical protein
MNLRLPYKLILVWAVALLFCAMSATPHTEPVAMAQGGGSLAYGDIVFGSITPQTPLQLYSFSGTLGDLVEVHLRTLSTELVPFVDLLAPDAQTVASGQQDSFATNPHDVQITLVLPQTGVYSLMVGGAVNTTGDYSLELDGRGVIIPTPLIFNQALPVTVSQNVPPQYFSFTAESCPTTLAVLSPSQGVRYTFPFIVKIRAANGGIVAALHGGDALQDRVTVTPESGTYEVEVWADNPALSGTLTLLVTCAGEPQQCLSTDTVTDEQPAGEVICPDCPPCPSDSTEDPLCAEFGISVDANTDGIVTVSWPSIEGANAAIISATDEEGALVYARMVEDTLTDTIDFPAWDAGPGTYTIHISVGSEDAGYSLCADTIAVTVEGEAPAGDDDECVVDIVAPRETMANGLQTFFWTDVPGAESYQLSIYGEFDNRVAAGSITAPATSMTLDVSQAAIGVGYSGGNDFYIQINAYRDGASWCANGVRVTRNP